MKILIETLGCKLNFAESSALMNELVEAGHERCAEGETPDLIYVNTCSVTDAADHKDRQAIRSLHRRFPEAKIIVLGCYAQLKPDEIRKMEGVIEVQSRDMNTFRAAYSKDDRTRCFLKVQDGCNYWCTYCTIPMARGRSRNPKIADVVAEAERALSEGAKEIVLTGVNIGDFGRSTGETFTDLVRALDECKVESGGCKVEPNYRIRISSCEPNLLTDEIIDFVAQSKHFAPHFHIPLQSGSNEVLKIMHRRYTRELFAERIAHIKQVMPNAFIGVDCMCGVRGETEEYFEDYVQFISSLPVSQLHVFTYSERANTKMLEMNLYVVPKAERDRRSKLLHRISEEKLQAHYAAHRGEQATVLWEANGSGWTENYIRVSEGFSPEKVNTFETITITKTKTI